MYGSILLGSYSYGDRLFGVDAAEITVDLSTAQVGILIRPIAVLSSLPGKPRIPELDINIDLFARADFPRIAIGAYGSFEEFGGQFLVGLGLGAYSTFVPGVVVAGGPIGIGIRADSSIVIISPDNNAVAWSGVGSVDFIISHDNVAGKMPLPWKGFTYAIRMLDNSPIVYGANGISQLIAKDKFFGERRLFNVGLKNKGALFTNNEEHYFILNNGEFWKLSNKGKELIGYKRYFSSMETVIISADVKESLLHICDGTTGYVYSIKDNALVGGYVGVTSFSYQDGNSYLISDEDVVKDAFSITTGIYDFGTRKEKTIFSIEVGSSYSKNLQGTIYYNTPLSSTFASTPTITFKPNYEANLPCYGIDFKVKVDALETTESFTVDYIKINGVIHGFSFLDTIQMK